MEKHLHLKIEGIVKAEAKAYAARAPMSLGQMIEKALKEYMQKRSEPTETQQTHKTNKESL